VSQFGTAVYGAFPWGAAETGSLMHLKHKTSQILFSYWDKVRGNRGTPRRFEIDPGKIAPILPSTFILERVDADHYRYRLAGTQVCDMFGTELRGTNFLAGWSSVDRISLVRHLAALSKQGAVETVHMEAAPTARPSTPFEMILLPLRHTGENIDRVLGALSPLQPPDWLGELPLTVKRIISHELIWPSGLQSAADGGADTKNVPVMLATDHTRVVRSERRQFRVFEGGLGRGDGDKV
jgi:hypothetical protein